VSRQAAQFSTNALQLLAEDVNRPTVRAIARLCQLAIEHPDFGTPGSPGPADYERADVATELLWHMQHDHFVEDYPTDVGAASSTASARRSRSA
jgi:hypothetical protein